MQAEMYPSDKFSGTVHYCLWCFSTEKLSRCSRCGNAYYCSRDHQVQHWKIHRKDCKKPPAPSETVSNIGSVTNTPVSETVSKSVSQSVDELSFSGWINNNIISQDSVVQNTVGNVGSASYPLASLSSSSSTYNVEETPPVSVAFPVEVPATSTAFAATQNMFVLPDSGQTQSSVFYENNDSQADDLYAAAIASAEAGEKIGEIPTEGNVDLFSSLSSELLSSSNNYWDVINNCDAGSLSLNYDLDVAGLNKPDERVVHSSLDDFNFAPEGPASKTQESTSDETACNVPLEEICLNIINDLNEYGICVIDNFLGEKLGDLIAAEVKSLFLKGIFKKGELARSGMWRSNENIRGDVITWVDGNEPNCRYIGSLIRKLDVVMTACNKMPDNGILSKYKLNRRTKAMIACYPGDGTHYKKHVDNPNGDGRCITCIYYLNKKWDTKVHGGLLRMFPVGHENEVANIEPTFDRMLFFWSDRRNPHEVLPSYAVRFAITVWYFDSDERDRAVLKFRNQEK